MDVEAYLETVRGRLSHAGFSDESPAIGAVLTARRRELKLTRFGLVETFVAISALRSPSGPDDLRTFGADMVGTALDRKSRIPRGLGSGVVVYPVLVVDEASVELRQFVTSYAPKHWCVLEYPAVVDTRAGSLLALETTPFWGSAYYRKTRREAQDLVAPA